VDGAAIARLVADLESDLVERKESLTNVDRVCEAICAFSNDLPAHGQPGVVALGVDDGGRPTGLTIDDQLLLRLAGLRDNGRIYPFPSMRVERLTYHGVPIAVAVVEPSAAPPVQYRGRTWIRVGPRRAIATPEEEARLTERRRHGALAFDARPLAGASIEDLDVTRFTVELLPQLVAPDVLYENRRSPGHQLASLRFADRSGVPTPTGMLFAGRDPLAWLPGASLQFLRLDGTSLDAPVISSHRLTSPLPNLILEAEEVLRAHIEEHVDFAGSTKEGRRANVPFEALQQVVRNAVMHRTYEATSSPVRITWFKDRVEVQSPGGPYGLVNTGNFGQPGVTDYRNPTIAGVLAQLGFVQRFGAGLQVAQARMGSNGNPPLDLQPSDTFVNIVARLLA